MSTRKRDSARIERRLVTALTHACETAKAQIPGFEWLTHEVDYQAFPQSLRVVWVFDSEASKAAALAKGQAARMHELTVEALADAEVQLAKPERWVHVDSEEQCQRQQGGDWRLRLARLYAVKG